MINRSLTRLLLRMQSSRRCQLNYFSTSSVPPNPSNKAAPVQAQIPIQDLPAQIQIAEELHKRELQLFAQHKSLQAELDTKLGNFFYRIYGTNDQFEPKDSYMANRLMGYYGITPNTISNHLLKIFKGTLYAAAAKDQRYLSQYAEPGFAQKILDDIRNAESKFQSKIRVYQDPLALGKVKDEVWTLEMALIRGLSWDRSKNGDVGDYIKYEEQQDMGLTIFTPKYLSDPLRFIDPQANKTIYDDYSKRLIMRVFARIKTPLKLRVVSPTLPSPKESLYTWEHLAIFENEMVPPKVFTSSYKLQTYLEWLSRFKFGCWRISDIDNCMKGNSLFKDGLKKQYQQQIFQGTKYDKDTHIDVKDVVK